MSDLKFKDFNLSEEILSALEKLNYKEPSKVQQKVIPLALKEEDLIVKSETGSGKTASFGIPICENIEWEENKPQALILTPTRELAVQINEEISSIGRLKRIRCVSVFGKQPFSIQERELKQKSHIVVGTPGRVLDHIERKTLDTSNIKYLIIDEADKMLDMGFIETVEKIINNTGNYRVTMLFSATISQEIEELCKKYMKNPVSVEINPENITNDRIEHLYYEVNESDKSKLLKDVLTIENPENCMIFCRTKEDVNNVFNKLRSYEYPCNMLHGGMEQKDRLQVMKDFKIGKFKFLVCTDIAGRGIDVENITHVINYNIPLEKESYVHRIGRTGRAGKSGKAITFVTPYEDKFLENIVEYIGFSIPKLELPDEDLIEQKEKEFKESLLKKPKLKKDKREDLNKDITKIYINAGKKKKIRNLDIVGTICSIEGVLGEDIGIIDVQENISYVDILNGKGNIVLKALKSKKIKGKSIKVEKAKN